jgi:hypothetical protein
VPAKWYETTLLNFYMSRFYVDRTEEAARMLANRTLRDLLSSGSTGNQWKPTLPEA